jgi:hypothetical protein
MGSLLQGELSTQTKNLTNSRQEEEEILFTFFFGAKIQFKIFEIHNIITQMSSLCVLCKIYASKEDAVFVFGV